MDAHVPGRSEAVESATPRKHQKAAGNLTSPLKRRGRSSEPQKRPRASRWVSAAVGGRKGL